MKMGARSISKYSLAVFAFIICLKNPGVFGAIDDSNDLIYTEEEAEKLNKFREMVKDNFTDDFMTTDFYLMRWLRATDMDLEAAKVFFLKNINWRIDNNISSILDEDWEDLKEDFRLEFSGSDRDGRPIGTIDLGDWDLRAISVTGKQLRLMRYLAYSLEKGMFDLFHARENLQNISRGIAIIDAGNLGLRTHLCPSCLGILSNWVSTMDNYYPQFLKEIIVINAPYVIKILHNAIWPLMSTESRNMIKTFNYNAQYWGPYLEERIDPSQRTPRYGGTRVFVFGPDYQLTNSTAPSINV